MLSLNAKIREKKGKKVQILRKKGILPGVLYGPGLKNTSLEVDVKEFGKVYQEAGESSLISLEISKDKFLVLIHEIKNDPLTEKPLHVDFYQPNLKEEIEVMVPLVFKGEAPAVKELAGTLVKHIHEIEVKALPQNLPHEIPVDVNSLTNLEDNISIKELILSQGVKIDRDPEDLVASVVSPEKVEEELEKPVEEKVEEVERVEEKKEEKEEGEEEKEEEKGSS